VDQSESSVTAIIIATVATIPRISTIAREVTRGAVVGSAVRIRIRRRVVTAVGVIVAVARRRRRVVIDGTAATTGRGSVSTATVIVELATRATVTVTITVAAITASARTVAAGRSTSAIIVTRGHVGTAPGTGAARPTVPLLSGRNLRVGVGNTGDLVALELAGIEFLNGSSQVVGRFELDEATAIAVAGSFRVNDVDASRTGKVFEILYPESM